MTLFFFGLACLFPPQTQFLHNPFDRVKGHMRQTPRSQPVNVILVNERGIHFQERGESLCHVSEDPLYKQILQESVEVSD